MKRSIYLVIQLMILATTAWAAEPSAIDTSRGDTMLAAYFERETDRLADLALADIASGEDWEQRRDRYRAELLEMLGLDPLPPRSDLQAKVTGIVEHDEFRVEKLHFQSRPGLYVTGNLYVPREVDEKLPAILYVCGHGRVKQDGISYGNKVHYQHHGAWFARNGYVCLTIDTLQLGEIEGIHHGTYSHDRWWWLNRGYTPAGVEAWNCIRALDYLETRPEVDSQRFGVTGRSGGGAYSWWIAAIDERIKCAVPVAGITDLENHVVDGCIEGHCDCMYMVNTYRWDYAQVAALVSPRPLLISNTDTDRIFPLDGVVRTFNHTRRIYELQDAADKAALHITAGGHKDTQELRVHAFRWLNYHLRGDESLIEKTAIKYFEPQQLKVFSELPGDEINTTIDETFVARAEPAVPDTVEQWTGQREGWRQELRSRVFAGWPDESPPDQARPVFDVTQDGVRFRAIDFVSQTPIELRLYVVERAGLKERDLVVLNVLDEPGWTDLSGRDASRLREATRRPVSAARRLGGFRAITPHVSLVRLDHGLRAPRGIGPTVWDQSPKKQTQHQRRFYLLGQTLDGMRVWDVRRAVQTLRAEGDFADVPLWLQSQQQMAGVALYASLFEPEISRLDLHAPSASHRDGPFFLNVTRFLDMPQAVAMAAERSKVALYSPQPADWEYAQQVAQRLQLDPKRLQIRKPVAEAAAEE